MNQVLNDNRKFKAMTADEADALFAEIAKAELEVVKLKAAGDLERAKLNARYEEKIAHFLPLLDEKKAQLTAYIQANPARFIKPRMHKTVFGSYGYRNVSNLQIDNPEAVLKFAKENKMTQLYTATVRLEMKAIEKLVRDGVSIPETKIVTGERIKMDVAQELMKEAKGNLTVL